eukprot:87704_1
MTLHQIQSKYQTHIQALQRPLYEFVKDETDLRLKYLVLIVDHPVDCLCTILNTQVMPRAIQLHHYNINRDIYQKFLSVAFQIIQNKCERGINFGRFKKEVNEKTIWNTLKGYWFHEVPTIITQYLWIPLLRDIAQFYFRLAGDWSTQQSTFDGFTLQKYLHKKFLPCLLEVKCKINKHSTSSGSVIQSACWKQESFQQIICSHFDDDSGYTFTAWMNHANDGTQKKSMRVQQIVSKFIKMHAQFECKRFLRSIGINTKYTEHIVTATALGRVSLFGSNRVENTTPYVDTAPTTNHRWSESKNNNTNAAMHGGNMNTRIRMAPNHATHNNTAQRTQNHMYNNNTNYVNHNNTGSAFYGSNATVDECAQCTRNNKMHRWTGSNYSYTPQYANHVRQYGNRRHHPYKYNCNCTHCHQQHSF